jgi:hypothetical protein
MSSASVTPAKGNRRAGYLACCGLSYPLVFYILVCTRTMLSVLYILVRTRTMFFVAPSIVVRGSHDLLHLHHLRFGVLYS